MEGLELNSLFATQFAIQLGLFLLSFFVLKRLIFKPFIELIQLREQKTEGMNEAAEEAKEKAAKLKTEYDNFMKAEYKKTSTWLEEERKKITEQEHTLVQNARDEVGKNLQATRKQLQEDTEKVRAELSPLVADFASRIATKLVGRQVDISSAGAVKKNLNNRPTVQG